MKDSGVFISHIKYDGTIETVKEHVECVAKTCSEITERIGLKKTGYLCGLIHDMGKMTKEFSDYITKAHEGEEVVRGSINHTFAGVIYLFEKYHNINPDDVCSYGCSDSDMSIAEKKREILCEIQACEIISFVIGSHHGVFDCVDVNKEDGFFRRLEKDRKEIHYYEAVQNYFNECATEKEIDELFKTAAKEIDSLILKINKEKLPKADRCFAVGVISRLLLSSLVEADWKNTWIFMNDKQYADLSVNMTEYWDDCENHLEKYISKFPKESEIDKARMKISEECRNFSDVCGESSVDNPGVYRLSVPTGSGKTLSSFRYALKHAKQSGKKRIFYIAPLLTILEQNTKVIKEALFDEKRQDEVLEHSSDIVTRIDYDSGGSNKDELNKYELLIENWNSHIVVTSLVQFLNTLFADKLSCIRRMNSLIDSIIIIDEIQSLPIKTIAMFNQTVNLLAQVCNVTVVLCSATQPPFEDISKHKLKFGNNSDIVKKDSELWKHFERTRIINECNPYGYDLNEAVDFVCDKVNKNKSVLTVCNTKKSSIDIFNKLLTKYESRIADKEIYVFYLSAGMCKKHRQDVLEQVIQTLDRQKAGEDVKLICVSTQIIEAGIDISFECVIRMLAGIDSIAQSAGRCNRSGEFGQVCEVYIINAKEKVENLSKLKEIRDGQNAALSVLYVSSGSSDKQVKFSDESVKQYYEFLFDNGKSMEYPFKYWTLFELLSRVEENYAPNRAVYLRLAFKTAWSEFEVFDEKTNDVIVNYDDESDSVIKDLLSQRSLDDIKFRAKCLMNAKKYTVSLYDYQIKDLVNDNAVHEPNMNYPFYIISDKNRYGETGIKTIDEIIKGGI